MTESTQNLMNNAVVEPAETGIPRKWIILGVAKLVLLLIAGGVVFSLYGCNTVRGIGQDIEKAGDAIQRSSR